MVVRYTYPLAVAICILSLHSPAFVQPALPSNLHVSPIYLEIEYVIEQIEGSTSPAARGGLTAAFTPSA